MKNQQTKAEDIETESLKQLNDILLRHELKLPLDATALLTILRKLDNPYELMSFLDDLASAIASEYGHKIASRVIPEISAGQAQLARPNLANLSYKHLETILDDTKIIRKFPDDELSYCQAAPDMQSMLEYIRDNSPILTKTLKQLNHRSVAEINARFIEPQQTVHDYGDKVFTDRDERNIWKLRFLRTFAQACNMTYVRKGRLRIAKRGVGWLELDDATKVSSLFRAWCEDADWGFWHDWFREIADCLHFELLMLYQVILAMDRHYGDVEVSKSDTVCATLCGIVNEPDEYGVSLFRYQSYFIVLRPFTYLGLASPNRQIPDKKEYDLPKNVSLTNYGKWRLNAAIREEWTWIKARSICPDCQKIHT